MILAVLCLSLLVVVLDNTVLNVAIPSITNSLGASTADIQWMINAYSLVLAGLLLTTGSLSDRFGRKRSLLIGLVLFTGGSAFAAFAETSLQLIIARGGMGVGAAFLMPGTLAVLMQIFTPQERPKAIAAWSAVAMMGLALGPVVGGALLEHFWWGSVFLINLPVGLLAITAIALLVPESKDPTSRRADVPGVLLSMVMGIGIVYGIVSVAEHGWGSTQVLVPLAIGVAALTGFILWERRAASPMLDVTLFANKHFTGAVASGALIAFALAGSMFLFTQYLQFVLGYDPLEAGFRVMPLALSVLVINAVSPKVLALLGAARTVLIGLCVVAAGFVALSTVSADGGYAPTLVGMILIGMGVGVAMPASANALMSAIPPERAGIASGLMSTLQEAGNALGVAILGTVMAARFAADLPPFLPDGSERSVGLALGAAAQAPDAPNVIVTVQNAFVSGMSFSLVCGAVAALGAGVVAWTMLRQQPTAGVTSPVVTGAGGQ
ncbi:MFS transporter [Amycolatopsis antarctica]|uniref:MFS transporter n=1 Tax=Amycolatopsis antarctica TaxID=1854586 RepID=A0A263D612_9PSEU|nr:MFS transporter [Amycolatopsis antarctica]